ncbi:DUF724 domain-containing protein 3 [Morus notabilis]|uniref:DUF724 domain-containing protein 3 n=1 Tax=Morus notabilis TaxID=981085 RepID=UPI000CED6492|nr:DUF724 domain-containing protein 3 [Morus notabilis]
MKLMSPSSPFNNGDQVEVSKPGHSSTGPYYPATVLRSPAKSKTLVLVEYLTRRSPGNHRRLREFVDRENVRPAPPPERSRRCFRAGDDVDAFLRDSWWFRGTVAGVLEDSMYSVLFPDAARREIVCRQWNLRLHREWNGRDGGSWVPPLEDDQTMPCTRKVKERTVKLKFVLRKKPLEVKFETGATVEVTSEEEGYKKSWYVAKIIGSIGSNKFLVEHRNLVTDDGTQPLREEADARHVRPEPPLLLAVNHFKKLEKVDAWYNDGWWEGVIFKVQTGRQYVVYFSTTNEELVFKHSDLRLHQDWINGKWMISPKEDSSAWTVKSSGINLELKDDKPTFSKGMKVEIRSDDEGYQGSWYTAKIVGSSRNDKFLVEYETLRTDDETKPLKEVVDATNIRPCPPEIQRLYPFAVSENIDAWYNDGWWVGRISNILAGSKYVVYFWTINEAFEFDHCNLRPHKEWVDGKWVHASMV